MTILKNALLIIFLFLAKQSVTQYTVSGTIIQQLTKQKLPNISIDIPDLKKGTITDSNGNFTFQNLKRGTYLFEISHVGYKTIIQRFNITNDTTINFALSIATQEFSEVVVTAVTRATELKRSPIIVKTLDKNSLNQQAATNIIDALKNVPGVNQISTGVSISKPIIRGLGYNRVITLSDGIRQEGQQWGDEHGIEIDEYGIDKVEIVKGPGSLMYGSDGIAGVLNFISPKAPTEGKVQSQFITNYQTNNSLVGYSFSNAGKKNGLQWLGRFSNKNAGDYKNKFDGRVYNSGFKENNGSVMLGTNKNWGHTYFTLSTYNTTLNLVEGERDVDGKFLYTNTNGVQLIAPIDKKSFGLGFPHQTINHNKANLNNYFILNKGTLNADLAFQNNKRKEYGDPTNSNTEDLFFDLNTFTYNIRYNTEDKKGWLTSFGSSGMLQKNANKAEEVLIPEYQFFDIGAFVFLQKAISENVNFASGLRVDNRNVHSNEYKEDNAIDPKFVAFHNNYNGVSGSIGLSYIINKQSTLKVNLSRGFRAPNIAELASNGRHEGTYRYELGNKNLKSEISHQLDIAYFLNTEHLSFEITPYVNAISNYIYAEKLTDALGNDIILDPSDPAPAFAFIQNKALLYGAEIFIDIHPHPLDWLHIENAFSFVQATQKNQPLDKKYLPFIPAPKYNSVLKAQFKNFGKNITNPFFKIGLDYYFAQNNVYSAYQTETSTPGYSLLNATFGASIKAYKKRDFLNLYITADNLLNAAYQNHLSRLKYAPENLATGRVGVFNMGRNLSVKLIANL